jgi:hypothetical protein
LGRCESRWTEYGVEFRALPLEHLSQLGDVEQNHPDLHISRVAGWCFSNEAGAQRLANPFDQIQLNAAGLFSAAGLDTQDIPLAVFYWRGETIHWVDNWSVRRRVTQTNAANGWSPLTSDQAAANGQARFYHFQERLKHSDFTENPTVESHFRWLPPVGYLNIQLSLPIVAAHTTMNIRRPFPAAHREWWLTTLEEIADSSRDSEDFEAEHLLLERAQLLDMQPLYEKFIHTDSAEGISLESFWKDYTDEKGATLLHVDTLSSHRALQMLNNSWFDSAIDLEAREHLALYLVSGDPDQLFRVMLALTWHVYQEGGAEVQKTKYGALVLERWEQISKEFQELWLKDDPQTIAEQGLSMYAVFARWEGEEQPREQMPPVQGDRFRDQPQ